MFNFPPSAAGQVPDHLSTDPDDLRQALSSKEGWHRFVANQPRRPKKVSAEALAGLNEAKRARYNEARIRYHRSLHILQHSQLTDCWSRMTDVIIGQDADDGPGVGIALTGGPGHGKTAATVGFVRAYERELRQASPAAFEQANEFIPVAYTSLLRGAGLKAQMEHLLGFYCQPIAKSTTGPRLAAQVTRVVNACRTKIIVLDQAQNLRQGDKRDEEVAAYLKEIMDTTGATLILCGIDLDVRGPLAVTMRASTDTDREQLARRFALVRIDKIALDNPEWPALLTAAESRLILHEAKPGDLSQGLVRPLWELSEGAIGIALNTINIAANAAINDGTERITAATIKRAARTVASHRRAA